MKVLTISFLLVFALTVNSFGQEDGKWSAGVGVTPFSGGFSSALYFNRHAGERWQLGVMPLYRHLKISNDSKSVILGLNFNSRFYPMRWKTVLPYVYGFTGYFTERQTYTNYQNETTTSKYNYLDLSLGIGVQLPLGKRGWSLDANVGYFGDIEIGGSAYYRSYFYSFGIFKRFGKSRK